MAKKEIDNAATATQTATEQVTNDEVQVLVPQMGAAPTPSSTSRASKGLAATLKSLKVAPEEPNWFRVARITTEEDGKVSNRQNSSKMANIVKLAKKYGIQITKFQENDQFDIIQRVG